MKCEWIVRHGGRDVVLFFNGWGMDSRIARWLQQQGPLPGGVDLLSCHDYREPLLPLRHRQQLEAYEHVTVVSWSLGVAAAQQSGLERVDRAVAFNGTLQPVGRERGILPEVFQATLDNWSEENRERFLRRICGSRQQRALFQSALPDRGIDDQKEELQALQQRLSENGTTGDPGWEYTCAVIGGKDMIFLPAAQKAAWEGVRLQVEPSMPHVPWFAFRGWGEVLACIC
ncbi:DUF452 family protein [Prosthecochloris sp. N3]|uniref:DUF452 family protein n=1 Tax=Prosthecochloris ethylica TaxID=2743976 RepID=A0ABR9XTF0_9CHLB|nr:pimeloyl-ACP methyl esterase BioG family protein [Prosthecochloris ethylica]MBF0587058.1 DUF452 family protein [Prosthecochloris ethylica]MBF0637244.1 DUF452 family protein [Prosthecochloris ethylica]NUK48211.1 DUF452 family protein [Prosthecochloris ethylica]